MLILELLPNLVGCDNGKALMIGIAGFAITDSGLTSHRPVAGILIADGKPMAAAKEKGRSGKQTQST